MLLKIAGSLSIVKKVQLKKVNGVTIKFVIVSVWSNFSAQRPVINPKDPRIKHPKTPNVIM